MVYIGRNINKYKNGNCMLTLSQNKKIAISAIALFFVSFAAMIFFLENNGEKVDHGQVNILDVGEHSEEIKVIDPETMYREYLGDEENPVFVMNAEGAVMFATNDCCALLDVDCEEYVGNSFFDYINTKDLPDFVTDHMKLMQDPKLTEGIGPYRMIKGEEKIMVLFNANPILDKEGKVKEIVYSIKDITEQVEKMNSDDGEIVDLNLAQVSNQISFLIDR